VFIRPTPTEVGTEGSVAGELRAELQNLLDFTVSRVRPSSPACGMGAPLRGPGYLRMAAI
jgi:hypothetical protein